MIRKLTNFSLQFNFSILNGLKIRDDVLILSLQKEFPFNECDQATIQKFLPLDASQLLVDEGVLLQLQCSAPLPCLCLWIQSSPVTKSLAFERSDQATQEQTKQTKPPGGQHSHMFLCNKGQLLFRIARGWRGEKGRAARPPPTPRWPLPAGLPGRGGPPLAPALAPYQAATPGCRAR